MSALKNRIGPYLYADGWKAGKKFDFDRTFTVLIAAAYDAGVIGPESNGIVVLDDDNRAVILDEHMREPTGYYGPSAAQKAEFQRVMAMDWAEFSRFCNGNPRYRRGCAEDLDTLSGPDQGDSLNRAIVAGKPEGKPGKNILLPEMLEANADDTVPYKFPHTTREDIIVVLACHHGHVPMNQNNGGFCIAWNVKVNGAVDETGRNNGAEKADPAYDKAWEAYVEENRDEIWSDACSDGLSRYTDGSYSTYPGDDDGSFEFATAGRSGGHLILTAWDGPKPPSGGWRSCQMAFGDREDYIGWLKALDEPDLARLYKLVVCVDNDTRNPHEEVSYHFAFRRQEMEDRWRSGEPLPDGAVPEDAEDDESQPGL